MMARSLRGKTWYEKRAATPVYSVDTRAARSGKLPRVWITEPAYDMKHGSYEGRELVASYPADGDGDGSRAFAYAQNYFAEALSYDDSAKYDVRTDCFRAAEVLYLHAAQRGCIEAYVKLGILYADDLCQGIYFHPVLQDGQSLKLCLDARAVECFSRAAQQGSAEACWQLGDMVGQGRGCPADVNHAFELYSQAHALALEAESTERGNAALRLAVAYEGGVGCEQSFKRAYAWYRIAEEELACVVDQGGWYFKRARIQASRGVARMRQELVGGY